MNSILPRITYFLNDFYPYLILITLTLFGFMYGVYRIATSNLTVNKKGALLMIATTFLSLVLVFGAFEAYFRYVYDDSDGLGYLKTNDRWLKRHVVFNSDFVRDRNFEQNKKEGVIRIGAFGDSLTFGAGIKDPNNRFSNLLEKKLKAAGFNVEVYNMGKSGLDTEAEIEYYNKVKPFNFDIIVWEYYLNDIQPKNASTGTPIINNVTAPPVIKALSNASYFFDFLYWRFSSKYQTTFNQLKNADLNQYRNPEVLDRHIKEINDFVAALKADNKKFVVVIFPFVHLVGPNYPAQDIHRKMEQVFKEASSDGIIDLLPDLKDKDPKSIMASRFDSHPNEFVHSLAADKLFAEVKKLLQ